MPRNLLLAVALAVVWFIAVTSLAQAPPSADSYITSAQPSANFGSSVLLPVQAGTASYVRLNLGALPPNTAITKATLRLYVNAVTAPGSFDVYQVDSAWSERGLNLNNAPPPGASATGGQSVSVTASSLNQFLLIDITPLVQGWLSGTIPNNGVALALTSASGSFSFDSKESVGTGHQPELDVVFSSAPESTVGGSPTVVPSSPANKTITETTTGSLIGNATAPQVGSDISTQAVTNPATNFVDTTADQVVQVQQNGAGVGLIANAPSNSGVVGTTSASAIPGIVAGVEGVSSLDGSFGVYGRATSTSATKPGFGVYGQSDSPNGIGLEGIALGVGNTIGLIGQASSPNGFAIDATETAKSGSTVGMLARIYSPTGIGALILNSATGPVTGALISARTNNGVQFTVDGTGNINTLGGFTGAGSVSGSRLISTVANGTAPLQIASSTLIPNLNAALLGGIPASGFAPASGVVNSFNGRTGAVLPAASDYDFSQISGSLGAAQLAGSYNNAVSLSNNANIFSGNGSGLTGVSSGLAWPIVQKSTDYTIQTSDFSTPTKYGNFIVLVGTVTHTFTLPSQPPPNGSCVAIGDFAGAGINSGTNVYLSINTSGVGVDGGPTGTITQIRRQTYLICSDGTSYWRLGRQQTTPSQIGPWLYTQDTGAVNVLTTTYVNGLDGSVLGRGNMIYLLPKFANTSATPTLNVNGLGAKLITKFSTQPLAPGDLTTTALAHMIYDGVQWQLLNPQTNQGTVESVAATAPLVSSGGTTPILSCPMCVTTPTLSGTTGSIGGAALTAGSCTTGAASVAGAIVGHPVSVSASDGTLPNGLIILSAAVTSSDTVTVQLCATASVTPAANTYNVATQ